MRSKLYTYCMSKKLIPYFFLAALVAVLLFILGVRYGQQVEKVNKVISYIKNLPPTPTLAPTTSPLAFTDYVHADCKVSFLLPNELEKTSESSASAVFSTRDKKLGIALSCEKKSLAQEEKETVVILNKTVRAYEIQTKDTVSYRFYHINTGKIITITTAKQYLPLLQKSLTVTQ